MIPDVMAREVGWVQQIETAPYFAHAQFSDPATILALPAPSSEFPFVVATWRYARAVALAGQGDIAAASQEAKLLADIGTSADFTMLTAWAVPAADVIKVAAFVAQGRIARA